MKSVYQSLPTTTVDLVFSFNVQIFSESGCSSGPSAPSASASEHHDIHGVSDLCKLDPATEETLLENLQSRFKRDQIYVNIRSSLKLLFNWPLFKKKSEFNFKFHFPQNSVFNCTPIIFRSNMFLISSFQTFLSTLLVSINPYKKLSLYTPDVIDKYRNHRRHHMPPHIYSLADRHIWAIHHYDNCLFIGQLSSIANNPKR